MNSRKHRENKAYCDYRGGDNRRMKNQIAAIPTTYNGVNFRSLLEARWAVFLDKVGHAWNYEPFETGNYIPDFVVTPPKGDVYLLEIKPAFHVSELLECAGKPEGLEYRGPIYIAASPLVAIGSVRSAAGVREWIAMDRDARPKTLRDWNAANNEIQWRRER